MAYQGPSVVPVMTETGLQYVPGITPEIFKAWCRYAGKKLYAQQSFTRPQWPEWQKLSTKEQDYYAGLAQVTIEAEEPYHFRPQWLKYADGAAAEWIANGGPRNQKMAYKKGDYKKYHASEKMKTERAARNKNRADFEKSGRVHKGDGKEIDHKDGNPKHQGKNLRVISRHANRVKQ